MKNTEENNLYLNNNLFSVNQFFENNVIGAAFFSVPELVLLKANQMYLDNLDEPYNKKENSIGRNQHEIFSGYKKDDYEQLFNNVITKGEMVHLQEAPFLHQRNGMTYWDLTIIPVKQNGNINYLVVTITDVTQNVMNRQLIEQQSKIINEQNDQLNAIIDSTNDILSIFDKEGKFIKQNKKSKELFDASIIKNIADFYNLAEVYDSLGQRVSIEDVPPFKVKSGQVVNAPRLMFKRSGLERYYDVSGVPIFDEHGNFSMGVITSHDVTDHVMQNKLIEEQHDALYNILDKLDIPIMRVSYPDFKVVEINKKGMYFISKVSNTHNIKAKLIHGENIKHLIPQFNTGENYKCICEMVRDKNSIQLNNFKVSVKDEDIYINLIYQPILALDGEIHEFLIIMNDVTSEVIKRQKIEELMRMQEEFFSFITHEFRTPLTTISSAIQIMDKIYKNELTPNIRKNINMIRRNTYQQLRLVNSLLDITRAEAGYLKVHRKNLNIVNMTRLIIESVNYFAETKGVHIVFSSSINEKTIAVDDEKYERILLNLLSNAIRFTPKGKDILVKVSLYEDKVYIEVKDEGIGIPKNKQNIIFDRFGQVGSTLTRQSEGTGIGLYLVKLLIKAMDGDIFVESEEGSGTSFIIVLPDVVLSEGEEAVLPEITENRLVRSANLEFANIYLD